MLHVCFQMDKSVDCFRNSTSAACAFSLSLSLSLILFQLLLLVGLPWIRQPVDRSLAQLSHLVQIHIHTIESRKERMHNIWRNKSKKKSWGGFVDTFFDNVPWMYVRTQKHMRLTCWAGMDVCV